jgi:hypothetical protein
LNILLGFFGQVLPAKRFGLRQLNKVDDRGRYPVDETHRQAVS